MQDGWSTAVGPLVRVREEDVVQRERRVQIRDISSFPLLPVQPPEVDSWK